MTHWLTLPEEIGTTMTDDDKALVAELRINDKEIYLPVLGKSADRIEALSAENERLREALDRIYMEDRRVVDRWRQSLATGDSHLDTQIILGRFAEIARAALGDTE